MPYSMVSDNPTFSEVAVYLGTTRLEVERAVRERGIESKESRIRRADILTVKIFLQGDLPVKA